MSKIRCEICGIKTNRMAGQKRVFMAKFPLDAERCKQWVAATGNEDLIYVPIEKLHQLKYICGKHFRSKDFKKKKTQLRKKAVPCVEIAKKPLTDDMFNDFPLHISSNIAKDSTLHDHDYSSHTDVQKASTTTISGVNKMDYAGVSTFTAGQVILEGSTISTSTETVSVKNVSATGEHYSKRRKLNCPETWTPTAANVIVEASTSTSETDRKKINATEKQLTPRKRKLYRKLKKSQTLVKSLKKDIENISKINSPVLKTLIESTVNNQSRKPKGKRWTKLNKTVALAIYKKSPKAYRYLRKLLPMPSIRTLQLVLENMKMAPGIDPTIIAHLKTKSERLSHKDKTCVLLFDEIALKKRLIYNATADVIDGYEDLGEEMGRSEKIADHALVFMIQGLHKKIKQPIAFYLVKGTISTERLAVIIKTVVRSIKQVGYTILSTVCDQGPTNVGALNLLKSFCGLPVDSNYFMLDDEKVYMIYDVPHLFKSIRNNFYQAGEMMMDGKKAKWIHLVKLEEKNKTTLHFKKITKLHVAPAFRSKMRVKLAAQILSNTVAAILKLQAESVQDKDESSEILQTAQVIEQLDRLFDCTNGPSSRKDVKRHISRNVTKKSFHHKVWPEYIKILEKLHFLKSDSQLRLRNVRCVNGYIITIKSLQDIWKYVESKGFKYLNLRQLNQDALENLFGIVRQHCPTNRNPTCHHFISALKSAVLTRLSTPHSRGSNCESDNNEILFDFQDIVFKKKTVENKTTSQKITFEASNDDDDIPVLHIPEDSISQEELVNIEKVLKQFDKQPTVYVSGYIASVLLKGVSCHICINVMKVSDPEPNSIYNYISLREWWSDKTSLTYPALKLCQTVDAATMVFEQKIKPYLHVNNVCSFSKTVMLACLDFSWLCKEHKTSMTEGLCHRLSLLLIRNECQLINRSFAVSEESSADSLKKAQQQSLAK